MKDSIDNAFSKMPVRVADATQLMSNSINGLIENLNIAIFSTG